jgi:anaerobic ribonucleoside-triphosphate reductase
VRKLAENKIDIEMMQTFTMYHLTEAQMHVIRRALLRYVDEDDSVRMEIRDNLINSISEVLDDGRE